MVGGPILRLMSDRAQTETRAGVRLAELLAALSLATDLSHNLPLESALRNALLAVGLARAAGVEGDELSDVYYLALLHHLGCTGSAHEEASIMAGDDNALRQAFTAANHGDIPAMAVKALTALPTERGLAARAQVAFRFATAGRSFMRSVHASTCEAAGRLAERLGASPGVVSALEQVFGRWDGKIFPPPAGAEISRPARIVHIAHVAVVYHQLGGRKAALDVVRQRAGTEFDPDLAAALLAGADELLAGFDEPSVWDLALESEPAPQRQVPASNLNGVAQAFADFADLKSPRTLGHSTEVAALAAGACKGLGLDAAATETVRIAGLVHDLGRVSLPNGIWEKAGRWNASEWERVRLHPYYTERILAHAPRLRPYGQLAGLHHERLDGSGYHRGLSAPSIPLGARVLATADTYRELVAGGLDEPLKPAEAARRLQSEVEGGRLDAEVVGAVLEAAGQERPHGRTSRPAGLTDREVGVLRLVALGHSNKEVAAQLFISQPTVHTHVLNIYGKIGVRSRAGASLFAMENDLLHRAL